MKSKYLLRMDFKNFFPSIEEADLVAFLKRHSDLREEWSSEDEWFLTAVVFRNGRLTIGAPTSPAISNCLLHDFDQEIRTVCSATAVTYTRYADDLFFSSKEQGRLARIEAKVEPIVANLDWPRNLRINSEKTHHASKKQRRAVTGMILTPDGRAVVARKLKRRIRSLIHEFESLEESERQRLSGYLAFLKSVEPQYVNNLVMKFGAERVRLASKPPDVRVNQDST